MAKEIKTVVSIQTRRKPFNVKKLDLDLSALIQKVNLQGQRHDIDERIARI
ncbi:hypothetical protein [Viridibacillus sp. FSL H7-0596]|uniref:hypothetical protein n=1 Tax=Viridibacillus sp. FSL H7-0596 TaxID=1928923 RepID=UPI001438C1F1|nr:hypothetical protein [Viridibacillus sp. FSL H7-0596]